MGLFKKNKSNQNFHSGNRGATRRAFLLQSTAAGVLVTLEKIEATTVIANQPGDQSNNSRESNLVERNCTGTNKWDWHATLQRRPVFTVDYWPGVPALEHEGRPDISWDLEHIRAYADPVGVRTLQGILSGKPHVVMGAIRVPNVLKVREPEIATWQKGVKEKLAPLLQSYRSAGLQSILLSQAFQNSGRDASPEWYHHVKDWEECDIEGRPLSQVGEPVMACMLHPKMYEIIHRFWKCLSFLKDEPTLLAACLDNEPNLEGRNLSSIGVPQFGGNPYTQKAFRQFLEQTYGEIKELNQTAKTQFCTFDQIQASESNWLVRTLLRRFLSTIVIGEYQCRLASIAKQYLPNLVTITRLVSGYWRTTAQGEPRAEQMGVEATLLKDSKIDVIAWSQWWQSDEKPEMMGQLQVTAGLLRGVGKPIGVTEPMVGRWGLSHMGWRPHEVEQFVYRGLYYHLGMFNAHSWDRTGLWGNYNEPFGMALSQRPGYLKTIRGLREELDWMAPYETFGKPLMPSMRILVSRHARHFPGMAGYLYQNWLRQLCTIMEDAEFSHYELLEEQSNDLSSALGNCKGLVVVDACLEESTGDLLDDFVSKGGFLMVIGAPALVDGNYRTKTPQANYPISAIEPEDLAAIEGKDLPEPVECAVNNPHPVWSGIEPLRLCRPTPLTVRPGSTVVARLKDGRPAIAANDQVIYLGGFPLEIIQQRKLFTGFSRWCDVPLPEVVISQFENAVVVQNWDSRNQRYDGSVIDPKPWFGTVRIAGTTRCQIRELRQDHPWLAYHLKGEETVLEGIRLDPFGIKVFRKETAAELPHFEGLPESLGFTFWWRGQLHPVTGRFSAQAASNVEARFVSPRHRIEEVGWYVCEVAGKRVAEAKGAEIRFSVLPGKDYYLTTLLLDHPNQLGCPLCQRSAFE